MMNQNELQQALTRLHEELTQTSQFDDATRQALTILLADIQRVVADPFGERDAAEQSLALRLQAAVGDLESEHPRLTSMAHKIVDRLADLGI